MSARQEMVNQARNHAMLAEELLTDVGELTPTSSAVAVAEAQAHATLAMFWLNSAWEEER
jgi:hypothetical protein